MNSSKHHREKTGPLIAITHPIDAYRVARCLLYYPAIGNRVASLGDIGREHTADVSVDAIVDYKVISIGPHESDYSRRLMAKHLSAPRANPASGYRDIHRLASTARSKLENEANGAEHNLRLLVGHANLLDGGFRAGDAHSVASANVRSRSYDPALLLGTAAAEDDQ